MKMRILLILTFCFIFVMSALVETGQAATTFGGSVVLGVDQDQRTITFRTKEGQTWTLQVADPNVMKKQIAKGDDVTIEIDLNDRIIKVVKLSEATPAPPAHEER